MKPLKLWDSSRITRKGIVVKNFQDLVDRGRQKLGIPGDVAVKLVLNSDGSEVEDDDFLFQLPDHTVLIMLKFGENWTGENVWRTVPKMPGQDEMDHSHGLKGTVMIEDIRKDWSKILTLSIEDLAAISNLASDHFPGDEQFIDELKEAALKYLDEKYEMKNALDVVELLKSFEQSVEKPK